MTSVRDVICMLYESDEGETICKRVCVCTNYTSTPTEMFHTPSLTKLLTVATINDVLSDSATEFESSLASNFFLPQDISELG